MNVRQTTIFLYGIAALFGAASLLVLVSEIIVPLDRLRSTESGTQSPAMNAVLERPTKLSFEPLFKRVYRPSADGASPSTPSAAATAAAGAPQQIQLIGTIGTTMAILRGPDGSDALAEIGDDVNGDVITAIRSSELDIKTAKGIVTLRRAADTDSSLIAPDATQPASTSPYSTSP